MKYIKFKPQLKCALIASLIGFSAISDACTRIVYLGNNQQIITARSMDWKDEIATNLWIFPRGMDRNGAIAEHALKWTSKYGSVIASGYDVSTTDGVNEKGLVANLLWLAESQYPSKLTNNNGLSVSVWAQYMLDNFASVAEAIDYITEHPLAVVTDNVPGQKRLATLHLSLSDSSGDSAIIEYIDGKQVIHHSRNYQVMTNSPTYDKQLAMEEYWQGIGGLSFLPGTNRAADRFARASFYIKSIPKDSDTTTAIASVFSVIRNVSVPYGLTTEASPEISSTRWRTLYNHKHQLYFFESALTPNIFWTDLKKIDFSAETGQVKELKLGKEQRNIFSGDATNDYKVSKPFVFLGLNVDQLDY
ncbi:linear amide C-N hydrolase [Orbus wheelerorum]|uniref:linear amide C-N hydrolase n=1 Tax=Orbus wheelerorum TaxID=3074111 RepID=UPI00370D6E94